MLGRLIFFILTVFIFVNTDQSEASTYITKKSDTSKIVEKIEKEYAAGKISKSECTKKKSKALKLGKVSETICDNVEVKTVKKETKEEKKVEYIKKKEKKKKKAKKEFLKKTKDLSKKAKSWITKKVKKEKKHFKTIAQLPKSNFYFTATDDEGNIFIGYTVEDPDSKTMKVGNRKFKKISNGQAFQDDGKTQCSVRSEIDKATNDRMYTGQVLVKCPKSIFIGVWHQTGSQGFGIAQSEAGIKLDFTFSMSRNDAVASLKNKKKEGEKTKKLVKKKEKNYETEDLIKPIIKVSYNQKFFSSSKDKDVTMEFSDNSNYNITGVVYDKGESTGKIVLRLERKVVKVNEDGTFLISHKSLKNETIYLTAIDGGGNITDFPINIIVSSSSSANKFNNDKKYYAMLIGNNKYDYWDDLSSPINDITAIAKVLKEKYKFEIPDQFILKNVDRGAIRKAFFKMNNILTEDDYLLIYYSGHGQKSENIQKAYWIPVNAKETFDENWISTSFVSEMTGTFKAKHVLLMIDSCYSGLITKGTNEALDNKEGDADDASLLRKWLQRPTRLFITSGSDERVPDAGAGGHSFFAAKFLQILKENQDHIISREVYDKIDVYIQKNAKVNPQMDVIPNGIHLDGHFIFSVRN